MFKLCFENMLLDSSEIFLWKLSEDYYYSYLLQGFITSVLVSWKINVFGMAKEKGVSNEKAWLYEDFYYILLLYFKFCFRLVKPFVQIIMIVNIFHGKHGPFALVGTLAQVQLKCANGYSVALTLYWSKQLNVVWSTAMWLTRRRSSSVLVLIARTPP